MTLTLLRPRQIAKPWGRRELLAPYQAQGDALIGEIIFDDPAEDAALLLKLLFTSEKLSVQVHPDDAAAKARGYPRGKDEAWLILAAKPGACIAFGPKAPLGRAELRAAALDGSIEHLLDWRAVEAGDVLYSPAGTIHAIGPGLSLVEVQQNLDLTYRLYDYGRPRDLQLDDAIAVARLEPAELAQISVRPDRPYQCIAAGTAFQIEQLNGPIDGELISPPDGSLWLFTLTEGIDTDGALLRPLAGYRLDGLAMISASAGARLLLAYSGARTQPVWRTRS